MGALDFTSIILGLFTLLGGCAWVVNFRKDKQEANGIKADTDLKQMNLSKLYVDEFYKNIVEPLQQRVLKMESKLDRLEDAVHAIHSCPHSDECPVVDRMRKHEEH